MPHAYDSLSPDTVLNAIDSIIESQGMITSGHQFALNSYENRVYQIGVEDKPDVIAKFYRPDRWSTDAILEEHMFSLECKADDLPVVAPLVINGETLFHFEGFDFALFPKQGGYSGQIENLGDFEQMGRLLGRLHQVANCVDVKHRPSITPQSFAVDSRNYLLDNNFIEDGLLPAYESLSADLVELIQQRWSEVNPSLKLTHGDLHAGNLLWSPTQTENLPHMVDLDDCALAPRIQDIWMLMHGERDEMQGQLAAIAKGYELFLPFPSQDLPLIETLRTMRLMNYSAWLAKRWDDPAFKQAFPWFNTGRYWSEQILILREQFSNMQEPSLQLVV
jgi:Ser/Thr protein kinase RdoA (MazF antagonist)